MKQTTAPDLNLNNNSITASQTVTVSGFTVTDSDG